MDLITLGRRIRHFRTSAGLTLDDVAAAAAGEFSSRWFRPEFYEGTALVDARARSVEAKGVNFSTANLAGVDMRDGAVVGSNFTRAQMVSAVCGPIPVM